MGACAFSPQLGGDATTEPPPTVLSNEPIDGAIGVPLAGSIRATFSEAMDPATLTASTFTLTSGVAALPIDGTVAYADSTVVFQPTTDLASDGVYTATISTAASSASGVALAELHTWSFTGDSAATGPMPVKLRTAATYVILASSAITGTGATVTGNLGASPAVASSITGFSLIEDGSNTFWTSAQITGRVYAADNAPPTPTKLITAIGDLALAITDATGRAADVSELGAGNIGGMTLAPGVYRWTSTLQIPMTVTLTGNSKSVWIFQIAQDLTMAASMNIVLAGGALPKNVFWQVTGAVTIGAMAHFQGVVLAHTAITTGAGTQIDGRLLAQTAVTITGSTVVEAL